MVKKLISQLSVLVVLIITFTACSKQSEYTSAIPSDASSVVAVNLQSLIQKAELDNQENQASKQKILDALKSEMNAATFQQLEKVIKNPGESGIDLKAPIYVFTSPSLPQPTVVARIGKEDDLNASLDVLVKEQIIQPVTETDGINISTTQGGLIAFNASTLMITGAEGTNQTEKAKADIVNLLKQSAENSISQSEAFQRAIKRQEDIRFFASLNALPEMYRQQVSLVLPSSFPLNDIILIGGLSFEKGKIILKTESFSEKEEVRELIKQQLEMYKESDNTFCKFFPASTPAFINMSINGEKAHDLLKGNTAFLPPVVAEKLEKALDSLDGDIAIGFFSFPIFKTPTAIIYAEVKNDNAVKELYNIGKTSNEEIIELGKNEYVSKSKRNNIFFGIKDKYMYVTNDEQLYKKIGKVEKESVNDTPYAPEMKGKPLFTAANMEAILDLPIIKMWVGFVAGKQADTYLKLASHIAYISCSREVETGEITLCLKDKDTNALKQIVDLARQYTGM